MFRNLGDDRHGPMAKLSPHFKVEKEVNHATWQFFCALSDLACRRNCLRLVDQPILTRGGRLSLRGVWSGKRVYAPDVLFAVHAGVYRCAAFDPGLSANAKPGQSESSLQSAKQRVLACPGSSNRNNQVLA